MKYWKFSENTDVERKIKVLINRTLMARSKSMISYPVRNKRQANLNLTGLSMIQYPV